MDDDRRRHSSTTAAHPTVLIAALLASLAAAAVLVMTPQGTGWAWGAPTTELRWYLTGLDSTATMLQLVGNLTLLAVPAALVVLRWPTSGRVRPLTALGFGTGGGIELLQRILPLGRVVSPLDAVLNATGAVAAGLLVAHGRALRPSRATAGDQAAGDQAARETARSAAPTSRA